MPALEARLQDFSAAHVQPFGISVDSVPCHANWAVSLGGISFPLLADFHPKGRVAASYGLYLEAAGITDRATVIVDAGGVVRHISSVGPGGKRDVDEVLALCQAIDGAWDGPLAEAPRPSGLGEGATLYVKSNCGFSRSVLAARSNLHLDAELPVLNVSDDADAASALRRVAGKTQAPCLVMDDVPLFESGEIIRELVTRVTGVWPAAR